MKATTLEQAREICRRNANGKSGVRDPHAKLEWDRETKNSIVSTCGRYRLVDRHVPDEGCNGWFLETINPPRHLSGPYLLARDGRHAAQMHAVGMPLQADLA